MSSVSAPIPPNEIERLHDLRAFRILDTPEEEAYDDLAGIAAEICHTPIALVSLVDENRQWFKSHVGWEVSEGAREVSFCAHAILEVSRPLVVNDATVDPRFRSNPLVTGDPQIRFYAGAPLTTRSGTAVGTLCVIDRRRRRLSRRQLEALQALARRVVAELEIGGLRAENEDLRQQVVAARMTMRTVAAAPTSAGATLVEFLDAWPELRTRRPYA